MQKVVKIQSFVRAKIQGGNNNWDLTFYRSHVQDELLSIARSQVVGTLGACGKGVPC